MGRLVLTEHQEQVLFLTEFELRWPDVRILAIPNGGARNIVTAVNLKAEGVRSGVPDLFVPVWYLWIEMKRSKGGRLSPEQKDWIEYLRSIGQAVIVAKGATDGINQVREYRRSLL